MTLEEDYQRAFIRYVDKLLPAQIDAMNRLAHAIRLMPTAMRVRY